MKIYFLSSLILAVSLPDGPIENLQKLLTLPNHVSNPYHFFTPSEEVAAKQYNAQIDAIRVLGSCMDPKYVSLLIPFLDYPASSLAAATAYPTMGEPKEEKLQNAKTNWPAFAAILDIPHSEDVLSAYVLEKNNPLDLRLTALVVLRYKDISTYNTCFGQLKTANTSNARMLKLLNVFESQHVDFLGMVELKTLEDLAARQ